MAGRLQRSLRRLQRKVVFRSATLDKPVFRAVPPIEGIYALGPGKMALDGLPLALFRYSDRTFAELGGAHGTRGRS